MDNEYYKSCTKCGRPQTLCKGECCGKPRKACIRQTTPSCCNDAVIPTVTVATVADMKGINNALVHVAENNTTYYIDGRGNVIITWAGQADIPGYDMEANPRNLRNQIVTDVEKKIAVLYDAYGHPYMFGLSESIYVAEEVNKKLEEMAEDGTLAQLVLMATDSIVSYETKNDLVHDSLIDAGKTVIILGEDGINDGEGAYYFINQSFGEITLDNGLYAKRLDDYGANYYDEVKIRFGMAKDGNDNIKAAYYISEVPKVDKFGDPITVHVVGNEGLRPSEYSQKHYSTVTTNASLAFQVDGHWTDGIVIGDGVLLHDYDGADYPADYGAYLGIKDNNVVQMYPKTTTSAELLADGVKQCVFCFGNIVANGEINEDAHGIDEGTMSFALGQKSDGTIVLFGNEGRGLESYGLTVREVAQILIDEGCENAWELDGGGSFSMSYCGTKINRDYDDKRTAERRIAYFFNVQHETKNKEVAKDVSTQGEICHIKDKMLQIQFNQTEKKHEYVKFRVEENQSVEPGQYEQQILTLRESTPFMTSDGRVIIVDDESNNHIGVKFFSECYFRSSFTIQVENNTNSSRNFYCALFVGDSKEYQVSNVLQANEFKSVTLDYLGQCISDAGKTLTIRVWGNPSDATDITVTRGVAYFEMIPIDTTYKSIDLS